MNKERFLEKLEQLVDQANYDHKVAKSDKEWIYTKGQQEALRAVTDLINECV
jgi:hypothetical protein